MSPVKNDAPSAALDALQTLFSRDLAERDALNRGLTNLATLPEFDPDKSSPPPVPGKEFTPGVIGFRRVGRGDLALAIACGKAQVRYITLAKFAAMVEQMHDPRTATIMLQNFSESDDNRAARGQVLGRINPQHSAITVVQGVSGRIVRGPGDISLYDCYYIPREDLSAFYIAAKFQLSNADTLESMIAAFDGWRAFEIPLNPLNPFDVADTLGPIPAMGLED